MMQSVLKIMALIIVRMRTHEAAPTLVIRLRALERDIFVLAADDQSRTLKKPQPDLRC